METNTETSNTDTIENMKAKILERLSTTNHGALGWDQLEEALDRIKLGMFLRLEDGQSVEFTFAGEPIAYFAHRVPLLDDEGQPRLDDKGNAIMGFKPCKNLYSDSDGCEWCDEGIDTSLRTACIVATVESQEPKDVLILEGGPTLWKQQIMPQVKEWSPKHTFRITRKGTDKRTRYMVVPVAKAMPKAKHEAIEKMEKPDLIEALAIFESEIPF